MNNIGWTKVTLSVVLITVLGYVAAFLIAETRVRAHVSDQLRPVIDMSLTDYLFGVKGRRSHDREAVKGLIEQVNANLENLNSSSIWSPVNVDFVRLVSIASVTSAKFDEHNTMAHIRNFSFSIFRAEKTRMIVGEVAFSPNWMWVALWGVFVLIVVFGFTLFFPAPLRGFQGTFYLYLKERGVVEKEALRLARLSKSENKFTDPQWGLMNQLLGHLGEVESDIEAILDIVENSEDLFRKRESRQWFDLGLEKGRGLEYALELARSEDKIEYTANSRELRLRGLSLRMPKAPLLYYIWYLEYRLQGDGWVSNPRTNKRDEKYGETLENLADKIFKNKIDDRILASIQNGVTAKTLNDMRSKIKKEITNIIPEDLAKIYLVDDSRPSRSNPGGKDFRVGINPKNIHIIS